MRTAPLLVLLLAGTAAAAPPRIAAEDAPRHRGERVTLAGPVTAVESRPDGAVLMVGREFPVPVLVPQAARDRLGRELGELRGREVELTGTIPPGDQPMQLVLDDPAQLATAGRGGNEVARLRTRVRELEDEVARLRASIGPSAQTGVTYGPRPRDRGDDVPRYATQETVLAERGIPSRTVWERDRRVLYYGREKWSFDRDGQLIGVERD